MATYTWRGYSSDFGTASNWDPIVVPSTGDTALFNANPLAITGTGSVDTIDFSGAGWAVSGQLTANTVNLFNGSVLINGSTAQLVMTAGLGVGGGAGLNVSNGAVLSLTHGGNASFATASLNVNALGIGNFNGALQLGAGGSTAAVIDDGVLTVSGVFSLGVGGVGNLTIQDGAQAIVNAARDDSTTYLQLGAVSGSSSDVQVNGRGSLLLMSQDSAGIGVAGGGELDVTNGAMARFNSGNNALNPALVLAVLQASSGTVVVSGSGSTLVSGGSVIIGRAGNGAMAVVAGGSVTSTGLTTTQAALAVGAASSGAGSLSISGAGSQFIASGAAVIGGDNRGSGLSAGGTGTVSITSGGLLQTNSMTIEAGSSVGVDGLSQANIAGDLALAGALSNAGTLSISGTVSGSGTLTLAGGFTGVGTLSQATVSFTGVNTTLRVGMLAGTSQAGALASGDAIDLVGTTATISGSTVSTSTGSLVLAGGLYTLSADGNGGTLVTSGVATVPVFRFFDANYGTHFFTSSAPEQSTIVATRPDLVYEGVGLQAVSPAATDPNAAPVYRFFDSSYGTHFFTASTAERDTVIATRSDLVYEGVGFLEHTAQQPGDVAVYRFFDSNYGTHFYTADANERSAIVATRSDLVLEGIGFYAPP